MNAHMELFRERDKQLEIAFQQAHAFQIIEEAAPVDLEEEVEEAQHQKTWMDDEQFQQARGAMNVGQREIFIMVTRSIECQGNGATERIRIFLTGGGGVDKTFFLNLLRN